MQKLVKHNCPIEGEMEIEENQPCNWCGKIEPVLKLVIDNEEKDNA